MIKVNNDRIISTKGTYDQDLNVVYDDIFLAKDIEKLSIYNTCETAFLKTTIAQYVESIIHSY